MVLTPAMSKAQDLHVARTLPNKPAWEISDDEEAAFRSLNRVRASLTDDNWPKKVHAFHMLYGVSTGGDSISQLSAMRKLLRERLLNEEVKETLEASESGDLLETIDGLLDTIYVAIGWLVELGLTPEQINLAMEEVHASNMTKVDSNGQPIYDDGGKVLKGEHYIKCDLALVLDL